MIKVIIVSYNVPIAEADTLVSIRRIFERDKHLAAAFRIHVWDNSIINRSDEVESFFTPAGIEYDYTSTPHNLSLSEIYNKCATSRGSCGYLMILDQDTHITEAYLRESLLHEQQGHHLILPRVYSKGKLVSPATRFYCKGRLLNSIQPGLTASKNLLAINSGMIIDFSVFRKFNYHPDLRFYGTDTWFMVNYERHFSVVSIMVSELFHSLHIDSAPDKAWMKSYFQEQIRVNRIVFSEGWKMRSMSWLYNIYLKITKT
jgi:GT2 family glycosyltransferase